MLQHQKDNIPASVHALRSPELPTLPTADAPSNHVVAGVDPGFLVDCQLIGEDVPHTYGSLSGVDLHFLSCGFVAFDNLRIAAQAEESTSSSHLTGPYKRPSNKCSTCMTFDFDKEPKNLNLNLLFNIFLISSSFTLRNGQTTATFLQTAPPSLTL